MDILNIFINSFSAMAPLLFATLGCLIMQKAGIINLGVDGVMLLGGIVYGVLLKDWFLEWNAIRFWGFLLVFLLGIFFGFVYAFLTVSLRVNQFFVSFIWNFLSLGVSSLIVSLKYPEEGLDVLGIALLEINFSNPVLVILIINIILIIMLVITMHLTKTGLYLKAAGKSDIALTLSKVNVFRIRYVATIIGTTLMTMAGVILVVQENHLYFFNQNGLIAYALVALGKWTIFWSVILSYLMTVIFQITNWTQLQTGQWWWGSIAYLMPIFVMIFFSWSSKNDSQPEMINKPYVKDYE